MAIIYEKNTRTFHLKTQKTSYIAKVLETNHLTYLYWGRKINTNNLDYLIEKNLWGSFLTNTDSIGTFQLEAVSQEYPGYGSTDLRSPAIEIQFKDGTSATDFRYDGHKIYRGKPFLRGLPSTYVEADDEAETLEIYLRDELKNVKVILTYSVFEEFDSITKSVRIVNESEENINILRVLSANVDFKEDNFDFIHLSGAWARERHIVRTGLRSGMQSIESRRGASSHAQNPFMALARKGASEQNGDVYGFSLVYSGNFLAAIEVDMYSKARAQIGMNPFDFNWILEKNEEFQAPEAVLVYSSDGLTGMSQIYNNLYGKRLCRGKYRDEVRPILINNWEATYFDFNETSIKEIASEASDLGIELFVLDDGWFGKRDDDTTSLGDWFVNEEKIKGGLGKLSKEINEIGLQFGLWFEPEMVSPNSELYKNHPDWCIHIPGRNRSTAREQLILDLSRKEVCDYIIETVSSVLKNASISYVKWDMNRNMSEIGSLGLPPERQRETAHRYMLGLYRILEEITAKFPEILFESCSGGGGRFDPGMLYYMPQTWTSDDTDAIERLKIQFGTSLVYPSASMGCHVSAVPNHQVGRVTPIGTRGIVAMSGNFGYELDITKLTEAEKEAIKNQVELYKQIRETVQFGDTYRLISPFESNEVAWMNISKDKKEIVISYIKQYAEPNKWNKPLKLTALENDAKYQIIDEEIVFGGDELMNIGLVIPELKGDYAAKQWILRKI
ncbi:alpha-galactosidase [Clostridium beijerinckii]|uniref:Alpha-galactosidase n=1 Tax=Clostridium beijerinckii TaxID=1520 RepID=A0AB74VDL8_CLOBE|nr:alpha-galactosidase [Clostridium beijerinckii]NRZ28922.1 alpha-galactosidase [Clostridium beijerinckii]NYB95305.1 alpha-galactosidase [Clostridium beijerinckii]OOM20946.1 alpha-galactosidase [Clostridium beijerinckii]QUN34587.1 alpha-galactosidase [Clostridium beijerinckii]SQB00449.1 alpha-galactosidase [Clostridium beijerinckii]